MKKTVAVPRSERRIFYGWYVLGIAMVGGFLERISARLCAVAAMVMAAGAVLLLMFVNSMVMALAFAVVFGLAARGEASLVMIIVAQYYGRESYGTITGFMMPFEMAGLGLGPLVAALSFDLTGSYTLVFLVFIGTYLISAVALFLARKPAPPLRAAISVPLSSRER